MKRNRRPPKEVAKYMVVLTEVSEDSFGQSFQYFQTFNEAKVWATDNSVKGRCSIFKVNHDFLGDVEQE